MAQYISKSALVAEIKKQIGFIPECVNAFDEGEEHAYSQILSFIDTLEVKEVDLEKELSTYLEGVKATDEDIDFVDFAKHFFELGIKAQKGE